jgi:GTP-binding protein
MAFVDEVRVQAKAGRGGDGVVRWLHAFGMDKGGPSGGDGGKGGDVILEGVRDLAQLATYRFTKKVRAGDGEAGGNNDKHGGDGAPAILKVPVGTVAKNRATKEEYEILEEGQKIVILRGGAGGFGNPHFKSGTNRNPETATPGKIGEAGDIELTLKLIADAGLIGFPNAGKSSLLNALTRSKSKVGAYAFTTLEPNLGDFYGFILADVPGLIEGASSGRGLGIKFLKHIERTGFLVHLVSAEQDDVVATYRVVRDELKSFAKELEGKREIVILSKTDLLESGEEVETRIVALKEASGAEVIPLSIADDGLLKAFSDRLIALLRSKE